MKKIRTSAIVKSLAVSASVLTCGIAEAESSVTLYGLMSQGISYVNNVGGHRLVELVQGTNQASRFGIRGVEDLGSGMQAIFVLENGFDPNTGKMMGGLLFGRQAYVGIRDNTYGQLTLGRQYDVMFDTIALYEAAIAAQPGLGVNIGDNDNAYSTFHYSNAIKYVSPSIAGVQAELMYAMSDSAQWAVNRSFGASVVWKGNNLKVGALYMDLDRPGTTSNSSGAVQADYLGAPFLLFHTSPANPNEGVKTQKVTGAGGQYTFSRASIAALVTDVRYSYLDDTRLHLTNFDISGAVYITPFLTLSAGYIYSMGAYGGNYSAAAPHWNEAQVGIDYFLSKRTDVYAYADWTKAHAGTAVTYLYSPSSTDTQIVATVGIRHKF